jgi:hypothetical protein
MSAPDPCGSGEHQSRQGSGPGTAAHNLEVRSFGLPIGPAPFRAGKRGNAW